MPNSRNTGDPALASVIVTVGFGRPFQVESPLAPPVVLRVASPSGSQNQAFDCDTGINFQNEIANGCQTTYRENYGDWNDDGDQGVGGTSSAPTTRTARACRADPRPPTPAPDCVRVRDRRQDRPVPAGLPRGSRTRRCAPNNWP